jgi:S-adenosylmethionine/arginine decarboxylase-like enzyme
VEFWDSPFELLAKAKTVERALKSALTNSNLNNNIRTISYQFQPFGVSAQASSGRANVYIHTWPENGYSAIDIIADTKEEAYKILENLQKALKPKNVYVAEISRGISEDWGET